MSRKGRMPSDAGKGLTFFDKFADSADTFTSRGWFFTACVVTVLLWAPSFLLFDNIDTYQLVINTTTTIVTFLLVALLQNTDKRNNKAMHTKLNAIADGLADLLEGEHDQDARELRRAVGLEERETA